MPMEDYSFCRLWISTAARRRGYDAIRKVTDSWTDQASETRGHMNNAPLVWLGGELKATNPAYFGTWDVSYSVAVSTEVR